MGKPNGRLRWHLILILIGMLIMTSETLGLSHWLFFIRNFIRDQGNIGFLSFVVFYMVTSLALIPGTGLTMLAGALFSPFVAIALSSAGALLAAMIAFWIARKFSHDRVERWLAGNKKYEKYRSYISTHEMKILISLRLIPVIPQVVLNYVFGLTKIAFGPYVFWSWLCLLPGTTLYVFVANTISSDLLTGHILFALLISLVVISVLIYAAW